MITVSAIDYVEIDKYTIDIYYIDHDYAVDNDFAYLSKTLSCTQFSNNNILAEKSDWLTFYFIYHNTYVNVSFL